MYRLIAALCAATVLTACGGGGSGSGTHRGMTQTPPAETLNPEPFDAAGPTLQRQTTAPTAAEVADVVAIHLSGGPWGRGHGETWTRHAGLARFESPPTVRIAEGTSDRNRAMVHHAVAMVNRHLPDNWHLRIGADAAPAPDVQSVPTGELFVDFQTSEHPRGGGFLDERRNFDAQQDRYENESLRASLVRIWTGTDAAEGELMYLLLHEMAHVLGLPGHVPDSRYPGSIQKEEAWLITRQIPAIDGAALRAIYTRLDNGIEPEDFDIDSLGPWGSTQTVLSGTVGGVTFGVTAHEGVAVPWTSGAEPSDRGLAANTALRGEATWNGGLLGFTDTNRTVGGNARVTVNVNTLTGRADFTKLQSWPAGEAPGALGTGVQWNTGSLGYTISVSGNLIRSTGGDDGVLAGQFYGTRQAGVAGSIERSDLTAAFGAQRE